MAAGAGLALVGHRSGCVFWNDRRLFVRRLVVPVVRIGGTAAAAVADHAIVVRDADTAPAAGNGRGGKLQGTGPNP